MWTVAKFKKKELEIFKEKMIEKIEQLLFAKGARRVSLLVHQGRLEALGFWDSLGGLGYMRDHRMLRYMKNV